ncbi:MULTISPECIES: phosphotransferase-like protein [Novosphingobium]|uniref:phosphotransferase-like protein n=1 Tax=unclassified Novosphingobium TaxID=2644732 RepID=UPI0006C8B8A0|nr:MULTISPECIES: AAA family ATPase [unclassified Novosphingobium]KPH57532.1 chloramphenicol phosphotransferase [Novosphingobium sp. ST904]TCM43098.1 chloramphenicol 3-O-phosphotransferase [Novosphingobium sp. ST904]WRT93180.1 AAA family ATPase [Novosphingobium sp. RL4]
MSLGQIVVVNGTSGSGKSTACELFQKRQQDYWLLYGIDHFLAQTLPARFGHHGPLAAEGIEAIPLDPARPEGPLRWRFAPRAMAAFGAFHEWMAASSRQGLNVIFDHLLMTDPPVLQDLLRRTEGLPVLLVTLKPPFEVLERRVAERAMTKRMPTDLLGEDAVARIVDRLSRLRPWFFEEVYRNSESDLVIDTSVHSPDQVCALVEARLAEGPGTAFDRLRKGLAGAG